VSDVGLVIELPPGTLATIVAEVREQVLAELGASERGDERWPEWMSVETAARYLDASPERVRKLQSRGELPYHQDGPGCRVFFRRRELDEATSRWRVR
jgi:excisionase family DNA binding protein